MLSKGRILFVCRTQTCLAVTDRAVHKRIDITFTNVLLSPVLLIAQRITVGVKLLRIPLPIELGNPIDRPQMLVRLAMATDTPSHRQLLRLINRLHLIDPTMASDATDA